MNNYYYLPKIGIWVYKGMKKQKILDMGINENTSIDLVKITKASAKSSTHAWPITSAVNRNFFKLTSIEYGIFGGQKTFHFNCEIVLPKPSQRDYWTQNNLDEYEGRTFYLTPSEIGRIELLKPKDEGMKRESFIEKSKTDVSKLEEEIKSRQQKIAHIKSKLKYLEDNPDLEKFSVNQYKAYNVLSIIEEKGDDVSRLDKATMIAELINSK